MFEEYVDKIDGELFPAGKLIRLMYDNTVNQFKLITSKYDILEDIRKAFSCPNPTSFFVSRYGYKTENKLYAINKFGLFDIGLIWEVLNWIKQQYGSLNVIIMSKQCLNFINDQLKPLKDFASKIDFNSWNVSNVADDTGINEEIKRYNEKILADETIIDKKSKLKPIFNLRDYQWLSIKHLLLKGFGRGLIEIPTAGGKSLILANFCWNLHKHYDRNLRYLILVPNKQLVTQMYNDFIDYGFDKRDLTKCTGGLSKNEKFNPDTKYIFANRQYLFKHTKELKKIDVLICDEVHQTLSDATAEFIQSLNCKIKIGCSGTLPRDKWSRWKILGMFSKIVYQEDITTLQQQGYISKLKITLLKIKDKSVEADTNLLFNLHTTRKYRPDETGYSEIEFDEASKAEHEYFAKHYKDLYKPVLDYISQKNGNILILFDRLDIGKNIYQYFKELYTSKNCFYTDGSTAVKIREDIRTFFECNNDNFLFANVQIMSTGINIKRLNTVVFCFSSKSTTRIIQSIGRVLRLHSEKTYAELIDCVFNTKYSRKHYAERKKLYYDFYGKKPDQVLSFEI